MNDQQKKENAILKILSEQFKKDGDIMALL